MIHVHRDGLQTVIPLLIQSVTSILHTFLILSVPSMIEFFKTLINCLNWLSKWYRFIGAGCKHLSSCLSGVSHQYWTHFQFYQCHLWFNFSKLWKIASIWYSFIQAGCKQFFPCLSGMSHQYCKYFQFYQGHLWLNSLKLWDRGLKFS